MRFNFQCDDFASLKVGDDKRRPRPVTSRHVGLRRSRFDADMRASAGQFPCRANEAPGLEARKIDAHLIASHVVFLLSRLTMPREKSNLTCPSFIKFSIGPIFRHVNLTFRPNGNTRHGRHPQVSLNPG